jgi:hypothetical protein
VRDVGASLAPVIRLLDQEAIGVAAVEQARVSLDDVFLHYTGDRPRVEARVEGAVSSIFAASHGRRARSRAS